MNIFSYPIFLRPAISVILCVVSLFLSLIGKPTIPYKTNTVDMSKFELTFSDEFDGEFLDMNKWGGHYFWDDYAVRKGSYWSLDLATVKDGNLHISTKYYPEGLNGNGKPGWYTCGIDTHYKFEQKYGYFETRCILPKGSGLWSAFWVHCDSVPNVGNGGVDGAEIDIFESCFYENKGIWKNAISANIHIDGYGDEHQSENVCRTLITANNPYEEFNTYGLEWNEKEYIFYINGVEVGRTDFGGASQVPEWPILSVEVGGENATPAESWVGADINSNADGEITDFIVDYVRVYQYK